MLCVRVFRWCFAVLLWELFTLGCDPKKVNEMLCEKIQVFPKTEYAPQEMYDYYFLLLGLC